MMFGIWLSLQLCSLKCRLDQAWAMQVLCWLEFVVLAGLVLFDCILQFWPDRFGVVACRFVASRLMVYSLLCSLGKL